MSRASAAWISLLSSLLVWWWWWWWCHMHTRMHMHKHRKRHTHEHVHSPSVFYYQDRKTSTKLAWKGKVLWGNSSVACCFTQDMTGKPWYNMSLQQRQPERTRVYGFEDPSVMATQPSLNTCLSSAYLGGCSIELSAHLTRPLQTVSFRYFYVIWVGFGHRKWCFCAVLYYFTGLKETVSY